MSPKNPTRIPDETLEAEPSADDTLAAQEEAPGETEGAPAQTPDLAAQQEAAVQAIKALFSELGPIVKFAIQAAPAADDSHNNNFNINVAVVIGNNQWTGPNGNNGIGGEIVNDNNQHL